MTFLSSSPRLEKPAWFLLNWDCVLCAHLRKSQDLGKTQGLVQELVQDEPHLWAQNLDRCRSRWIGANEISRSSVPQKPGEGEVKRRCQTCGGRYWGHDPQITLSKVVVKKMYIYIYQPSTRLFHGYAQKRQFCINVATSEKHPKNLWFFYPCPKMGKDAINSIINPLHPTKSNNAMDIPKVDGPWKRVCKFLFLNANFWVSIC